MAVNITRSDTYTGAASGTVVDLTGSSIKFFSLQCTQTGNITSWTIVLEGSNDGTNYTTILTHNTASLTGTVVFQAAGAASPIKQIRTRCSAMVVGGGTNMIAYLYGND